MVWKNLIGLSGLQGFLTLTPLHFGWTNPLRWHYKHWIPYLTCKDVDTWPGAEAGPVMRTHLPISTHYMLQQAWQINGERTSEREKVGGGKIWGEKTGKRGEETITSTTSSDSFYCSGFLFSFTWSYTPCLGEWLIFSSLIHECVLVSVSSNTVVKLPTSQWESVRVTVQLLKEKLWTFACFLFLSP